MYGQVYIDLASFHKEKVLSKDVNAKIQTHLYDCNDRNTVDYFLEHSLSQISLYLICTWNTYFMSTYTYPLSFEYLFTFEIL